MEGIGFDPQLVYFVLKLHSRGPYGEGGEQQVKQVFYIFSSTFFLLLLCTLRPCYPFPVCKQPYFSPKAGGVQWRSSTSMARVVSLAARLNKFFTFSVLLSSLYYSVHSDHAILFQSVNNLTLAPKPCPIFKLHSRVPNYCQVKQVFYIFSSTFFLLLLCTLRPCYPFPVCKQLYNMNSMMGRVLLSYESAQTSRGETKGLSNSSLFKPNMG